MWQTVLSCPQHGVPWIAGPPSWHAATLGLLPALHGCQTQPTTPPSANVQAPLHNSQLRGSKQPSGCLGLAEPQCWCCKFVGKPSVCDGATISPRLWFRHWFAKNFVGESCESSFLVGVTPLSACSCMAQTWRPLPIPSLKKIAFYVILVLTF